MQLQKGASAVCDVVMALVGCKIAPQRTWLHILFHTIPVLESCHPPVFSHKDVRQLLSRVQVRLGLSLCASTESFVSLKVQS